jgi:hypothetical protein
MIDGMPEPTLFLLVTDVAPHFIDFRLVNPMNRHRHLIGIEAI